MKTFLPYCFCVLAIALSCKKTDSNWRDYKINLSAIDIEQTGELSATVRYSVELSANPSPEVLEYGLIISGDPEAPFYGKRYPNQKPIEQKDHVQYLSDLEGETYWYVRSYAVTIHDTVLSEINSFKTGKYFTEGSGVNDIEGNYYKTVIIGNQEWMAESLKTRTFCNGDTLALINDTAELHQFDQTVPVTFSYQFDASNDSIYGKYYPGMIAKDDRNVCPCGWRIPDKSDIVQLANFVGNNQYLGGKMKSTGVLENGTGYWKYPNALANNLTGLNINPGGYFWKGPDLFYEPNGSGKIMILQPYLEPSGIVVDYPSSVLLQSHRREVNFSSIGENNDLVNIRCIKE